MPRAVAPLAPLVSLLGVVVLCIPTSGWTKLYRCTDSSGAEVFTDSPVQLEGYTTVRANQLAGPRPSVPKPRSQRFRTPPPASPKVPRSPILGREEQPQTQGQTEPGGQPRHVIPRPMPRGGP